MSASVGEIQQLLAYMRASRELVGWINGAKVLALLSGALDSGVLDALRTRSTVQKIADLTGRTRRALLRYALRSRSTVLSSRMAEPTWAS